MNNLNLARYTNRIRWNQSARDSQTQEERVILNEASRVHLKQLREMVRSGLRNRSIMDLNHAAFKFKVFFYLQLSSNSHLRKRNEWIFMHIEWWFSKMLIIIYWISPVVSAIQRWYVRKSCKRSVLTLFVSISRSYDQRNIYTYVMLSLLKETQPTLVIWPFFQLLIRTSIV